MTRCELDLHLSADNQLMVIHDATLKRTTGRRGKVVEHPAADLVKVDARKGGPGHVQPCPIPTLEELFQKCPFEHWQLEVKSASRTRCHHRSGHPRAGPAVQLAGQGHHHLQLARSTGCSPGAGARREAWAGGGVRLARPLKVAQNYGCDLLALNWTLCTPERLLKAQAQGLHVSVWTVNEPALMRRLADFGVDSLITDFPGLAKTTLGQG